jgi:hypothetical protein
MADGENGNRISRVPGRVAEASSGRYVSVMTQRKSVLRAVC